MTTSSRHGAHGPHGAHGSDGPHGAHGSDGPHGPHGSDGSHGHADQPTDTRADAAAADPASDGGVGAGPAIDSPAAVAAALRWGFDAAFADGARTVTAVAPAFDRWPLDDAALLERLAAWLRRPQRRLVLLATGFDGVPVALPRFTTWRRHWVHAIDARQVPVEVAAVLPTLLFDDGAVVVEVADAERGGGRARRDRALRHRWADRTDALLQRSVGAFAANTLGL